MDNPSTCNRCLLSSEVPGVKINSDGICSVCIEHDNIWGNWDKVKNDRLRELEKMFANAKSKDRIYDVLVPLSGGKDSIYVLYLCRKHFDLKCLAVTWDNGFLTQHARENIKSACDILAVDHIYYGINHDLLMRLYKYFFLKTGFLCPVCMRGIQVAISRTQLAFNIPFAVQGTAHRTEEYVAPEFFISGSLDFLENTLEGNSLKSEASALLSPVGVFSSPPVIKIPDYLDWNYDEIFDVITKELNWKSHKSEAEHTDCAVDNIVNYIRLKKFPALVPEMLRYSKLITAGTMSKKNAIEKIEAHKTSSEKPTNLDWFFDKLQITRKEFDNVLSSDPMRHMKFLRKKSPAIRRLEALRKRFF